VRAAGGRGRFYLEAKPALGLVLLKGKKPAHRFWLEKHGVNGFLKTAQKTNRFKEAAIERLAQVYALLMVEEEEAARLSGDVAAREEHIEHLSRKTAYLQDRLGSEEDAKRRTLLRYVNAVKAGAAAPAGTAGAGSSEGAGSGGAIQLPESGITDEEVHAIAALLRGNTSVVDLNLRGNLITDEGARALAAVLGGKSALRALDLRGNRVGAQGVRALAEALERCARVRHVYVHAGGKIEALGTGRWANPRPGDADADARAAPLVTVETVCVVDVRENSPSAAAPPGDLSGSDAVSESGAMPERHMVRAAAQATQALGTQAVEGRPAQLKVGGQGKKKKKEVAAPLSAKEEAVRMGERAREKLLRERQRQEEQRARDAEARWEGRAGGLELRLPALGASSSGVSSGQEQQRQGSPSLGARSAPLMGSIDASLSENPLLPRGLGGSGGPRK
jgi:myosin protein heavy chain